MIKMKFGLLLIMLAFASDDQKNRVESAKSDEKFTEDLILVKIEEDEYAKANKKSSKYIGVSYIESHAKWRAQRWSKSKKKLISNGIHNDEETAAYASDTLAKKLIASGEQNHRLNFLNNDTEVISKKKETSSKHIGVCYNTSRNTWQVQRWSKNENKNFFNGCHKVEETAAHASDTLARKLMENGEQNLNLNFPDDNTEVLTEKTTSSKFIGVSYNKKREKWDASRRSKNGSKKVFNGYYNDEEAAAHASDTLTRKLMANGEQNHKLNFPDDYTEVSSEKKKTSSTYIGVHYNESYKIWSAHRWNRSENKNVYNGYYKDEETAARASDILARKLMANGEQNHKLNFADDKSENESNKRKRSEHEDMEHFQNK